MGADSKYCLAIGWWTPDFGISTFVPTLGYVTYGTARSLGTPSAHAIMKETTSLVCQ